MWIFRSLFILWSLILQIHGLTLDVSAGPGAISVRGKAESDDDTDRLKVAAFRWSGSKSDPEDDTFRKQFNAAKPTPQAVTQGQRTWSKLFSVSSPGLYIVAAYRSDNGGSTLGDFELTRTSFVTVKNQSGNEPDGPSNPDPSTTPDPTVSTTPGNPNPPESTPSPSDSTHDPPSTQTDTDTTSSPRGGHTHETLSTATQTLTLSDGTLTTLTNILALSETRSSGVSIAQETGVITTIIQTTDSNGEIIEISTVITAPGPSGTVQGDPGQPRKNIGVIAGLASTLTLLAVLLLMLAFFVIRRRRQIKNRRRYLSTFLHSFNQRGITGMREKESSSGASRFHISPRSIFSKHTLGNDSRTTESSGFIPSQMVARAWSMSSSGSRSTGTRLSVEPLSSASETISIGPSLNSDSTPSQWGDLFTPYQGREDNEISYVRRSS